MEKTVQKVPKHSKLKNEKVPNMSKLLKQNNPKIPTCSKKAQKVANKSKVPSKSKKFQNIIQRYETKYNNSSKNHNDTNKSLKKKRLNIFKK